MSLLGQIVAGEAATPAGQQAVLNVMQNRLATGGAGSSGGLLGVATAPLQFSAYPNALGVPSANTEAMVTAAQNGTLGNIVPNSLNYANPSIMSQSAQPNSWVWGAQASGQGVQIGGNTFWANSSGGSPGYDPSQLYNGGSGAIAAGPADTSSGANPGPGGDYITMNPSDPNYGDITGLPVAGVNAPAATSSGTGSGVGNDQGTPNLGGGVTQPSTSTSSSGASGTPVQVAAQPELANLVTTTANSLATKAGQGVQSVITAAETGAANWLGQSMNWFTRGFLILLGIVIIAVALAHLMAPNSPIAVATRLPKAA
jgi:hypothetical protein